MIFYLLAKVQTIIENTPLFDIFLPQNIKIYSLLGQNGVKKMKSGSDISMKPDADYDDSKYDSRSTNEVFAQIKGYWKLLQGEEGDYLYMEITDNNLYYRGEDGRAYEKCVIERFDKYTNMLECIGVNSDNGTWEGNWYIEVITVSEDKLYIHYSDDDHLYDGSTYAETFVRQN